ncbi:MAG: pyridoxamine 5'-phosphate oxidase [Vicingaceae bacterium]
MLNFVEKPIVEEINSYINSIRRDFADKPLNEASVALNPFKQFEIWFEEAVGAQLLDPYAMNLCTVDKNGCPSVRTVYMRGISEEGIVFYTNYNSKKAKDISANPHVAVNFLWQPLDRQIRMEGIAQKVNAKTSDEYFKNRPRESQIGAWASNQSEEIKSREELIEKVKYYEKKFEGKDVPRPEHWGGFLIKLKKIEFWQGRPNRLHDRIVYLNQNSSWIIKRLNP